MSFCPNCGMQITMATNFCPNCGAALTAVGQTAAYQMPYVTNMDDNSPIYSVVLVSCGECTKTLTRDLLEDLMGYNTSQSRKLTDNAPIEIACNLTANQAMYLSQILSEYGIQVSVCNNQGYVNINQYANTSVFDSNGNLRKTVMKALSSLTVANCVNTFTSWNRFNQYNILQSLFTPGYTQPKRRSSYTRFRYPTAPTMPGTTPVARPMPSGAPGVRTGGGARAVGPGGGRAPMGGAPMGGTRGTAPMGRPGIGPRGV